MLDQQYWHSSIIFVYGPVFSGGDHQKNHQKKKPSNKMGKWITLEIMESFRNDMELQEPKLGQKV